MSEIRPVKPQWFFTCSFCGDTQTCQSYYKPNQWDRGRVPDIMLENHWLPVYACPKEDCKERLNAIKAERKKYDDERFARWVRTRQTKNAEAHREWLKNNPTPHPKLPDNGLYPRYEFIRRVTCQYCGATAEKRALMGQCPSAHPWESARIANTYYTLCPTCHTNIKAEFDPRWEAWNEAQEDFRAQFRVDAGPKPLSMRQRLLKLLNIKVS